MATQTLLCVEPDETVLATIRGALEPYGFRVTNITNGEDAVNWSKDNRPALVIVSVEPRKVGYAICNKFKRHAELKEVPLILTSSEETPQQLEQHRKLKVKANEYLIKPFSEEDLLAKVKQVHPLDGGSSSVSSDVLEEISIGDSDIMEEVSDDDLVVETFEEESTSATVSGQGLDAVFDRETDAAFAAIQQDREQRADRSEPKSPWDGDPESWDVEATLASSLREVDAPAELPTSGGPSGRILSPVPAPSPGLTSALFGDHTESPGPGLLLVGDAVPEPVANPNEDSGIEVADASRLGHASGHGDGAAPPMPDDVAPEDLGDSPGDTLSAVPSLVRDDDRALAALAGTPARGFDAMTSPGGAAAVHAMTAELERRVREAEGARDRVTLEAQDLRKETEELRKEIEEVKNRARGAGSSRAELFDLKDRISRSERENLDLKDALDAKDRQLLDLKDRIREQERGRRDVDDKALGFEKNLMMANERIEALTEDRDKSADRERALKARLDDAHGEIRKSHEEVDFLKKRAAQNEDKLRSDMDRLRGELEGRIVEMDESHRAETTRQAEERATAEAAMEQEHQGEVGRLKEAHAAEYEAEKRRAAEELAALEERLQGEISRLRREHDKAVASLKEEQALQLAAEREAHQGALDNKERDHKNEIFGMRRRHEEEMVTADERRQRELAESQRRHGEELEAAEARRRAELGARDEEHHGQIAEMDRRHFNEKTEMSERHRGELDQAHQRASRAEGDLAARAEELSEAHRRMAGVQADLDSARAELRDREVKLSQSHARIGDLENKLAEYEEQIMRAYQRVRTDDKVISKAKRAMAVALSVLEERGVVTQGRAGDGAQGTQEVASTDTGETRGEPSAEGGAA
jgi:DNA-binding response OmpR family regulator